MKQWNFNVKGNPKENSNRLAVALDSIDGFVFNIDRDKNNSVTFKMRKRVLYAWYMIYQNWTIVNGKLLKTEVENKTKVEISFTQHFLLQLIIYTHVFIGLGFLLAIFLGIGSSASLLLPGILLLALGIVLWIAVKNKIEKDTQQYKALISKILEHHK